MIIWTTIRQKYYCVVETVCEAVPYLNLVQVCSLCQRQRKRRFKCSRMENRWHLKMGSHGCLNRDRGLLTINRAALQQRHFGGLKTQTFDNGFHNARFWKRYNLCKLQKHEFVKTVTLCTCILRVQSIGMQVRSIFYKVSLPTTGLAWKNTALLVVFMDLCERDRFDQFVVCMQNFTNAKEKLFCF